MMNEINGTGVRLPGISGKRVVVTGGAVGIGAAVSRRFAELGAKVAVVYNSSPDAADELASGIEAAGGTAAVFGADISREESVVDLFAAIRAHGSFGGVDVLVNNSGIFSMSLQQDLPAAEWDRLFGINVRGGFLCSREASKLMAENHGEGEAGCIISLASINALHPGFGLTAHYDASKGAVSSYCRSLAAELGPRGIRVNAIAPGLVDSAELRETAGELAETVERRSPLKSGGRDRLTAASDVADTAVFLASSMAASITGEIIVVDRGYLLT